MNSPYLVILIGFVMMGFGSFAIFNAKFAENYARTSPKAWIWRKMLGEERAVAAVKNVFAPLALFLGLLMAGLGIHLLTK